MRKVMIGVGLGLATMSQAQAWSGGIEDMRTMQANKSGPAVRVASTTTDCCVLNPVRSHGHGHQTRIVHNGQTYYCTRVTAGHSHQVAQQQMRHRPAARHHRPVRQHRAVQQHRQHRPTQSHQATQAARAQRQAMFVAKAKRNAQLLAAKRQQAALMAAQKRKAVQLAQQKARQAHQAALQAQQRKRAMLLAQQKRKQQILAQQRRQAAQKRAILLAQQKQRAAAPVSSKRVHHQPVRHHDQAYSGNPQAAHQWQRSGSVRMEPMRRVIKPQYQQPVPQQHPVTYHAAQQSVDRHDAAMLRQRAAQMRAAQITAQQRQRHHQMQQARQATMVHYPAQQSVARHDARQQGWQRHAAVHTVRTQPHQRAVISKTQSYAADCGC